MTTTLARNDGFGLIEVMVAILLLTVGLLGTMEVFISSDHLNLTTQRVQALSTAAEQSLEQIRAMPYANLALSALPVHAADGNPPGDTSHDPSNPDYWVSGTNLQIVTNYGLESSPTLAGVSTSGEALIGGGTVSPGPTTVTSDGYTISVYRFISWVNDSCVYLGVDLCPGTQDAKRVTVAAVITGGGGTGANKPFWLSTVVANPNAGLL